MNLSRGYLLFLALIFGFLSLLLVLPFFQYALGALLIAYVLYPAQKRLEAVVSPTIAAVSLVAVAIVGFILPFIIVVAFVVDDVARLLTAIDTGQLQIEPLEAWLATELGIDVDITETLVASAQQIGTVILERSTEWFSAVTHILVGLGLALFLLYYLLKDGDTLYAWLRETTPLPDSVQTDLYTELDDVMRAVLLGHVLIALIEGVIAGLGLFATGIPNAAFWTFVMVILSLIPLIGAFLVWGPAVGYLLLTGEPLLAGALFVYSAIVVGVCDDYLRPIIVDRYAELSPAIIILGVLGGLYAFGLMGLFFGPVIAGALLAVLNVINDHYDNLEGDGDVSEPADTAEQSAPDEQRHAGETDDSPT